MNLIDESIQRLLIAEVISENTILGCNDTEIREIEKSADIEFPESYRYFLRKAGRKIGMFMEGSDYSYDKLLTINADAIALLEESNSSYVLTKTDFVFLMNQGYEFLFFSVNTSEQTTKVYRYEEGDELPQEVASSFEEWFDSACDDEIEAYEDLKR